MAVEEDYEEETEEEDDEEDDKEEEEEEEEEEDDEEEEEEEEEDDEEDDEEEGEEKGDEYEEDDKYEKDIIEQAGFGKRVAIFYLEFKEWYRGTFAITTNNTSISIDQLQKQTGYRHICCHSNQDQ